MGTIRRSIFRRSACKLTLVGFVLLILIVFCTHLTPESWLYSGSGCIEECCVIRDDIIVDEAVRFDLIFWIEILSSEDDMFGDNSRMIFKEMRIVD
jgi:hypothetical protein